MHHLNVRKTPAGRILAQRKDGKPLTPVDRIEAKYLAAADEPMEVGSEDGPLPYLDHSDSLVIHFASPKRFHWWRGGQNTSEIIAKIKQCEIPNNERETK